METVVVTIGGKEYPATQLMIPEQCEIARIMRASKESHGDFPRSTVLLREMSEVVCASIRRAGSNVTVEEVREASDRLEVLQAIQTLLAFTVRRETSALLDDDLPGTAKIQ